ncbi:MAG: hypothetical protein AAFO07_23080 [Bacteroidota bacterium]
MFIPPSKMVRELESQKTQTPPIQLKSHHLLIDHTIAKSFFGQALNVDLVYYADKHSLLIAPENDELFKKLHKTSQKMLKDKSLKGNKSIALHEFIIVN